MDLIRIEATNFDWSVADTKDLSTARGGSLAMLRAIQEVDRVFGVAGAGLLRAVSLGASVGVFEVVQGGTASKVVDQVRALLATGDLPGKSVAPGLSAVLPHLTFTISTTHMAGESLDRSLAELSTLGRWEQMQALSFAPPDQNGEPPCAEDKLRPAGKGVLGPDGHPISTSVQARRKYGREQKTAFYRSELDALVGGPGGEDIPTGDPERLTKARFALDFSEIAQHAPDTFRRLDGKLAVFFADGNGFGKLRDKHCPNIGALQEFDGQLRTRQREFLHRLLCVANHEGRPQWTNDSEGGVIRLEVLKWAGDDILIIVPAWCGWMLLEMFFGHSWSLTLGGIDVPVSFKAGLVYCNHKAPIHRVTDLAEALADTFARSVELKHRVAYEVLESFDHVGLDPKGVRETRAHPLPPERLVLDAEQVATIGKTFNALRRGLPRAQLYELIQSARKGDDDGVNKADARIRNALTGPQQEKLDELTRSLGGGDWA